MIFIFEVLRLIFVITDFNDGTFYFLRCIATGIYGIFLTAARGVMQGR